MMNRGYKPPAKAMTAKKSPFGGGAGRIGGAGGAIGGGGRMTVAATNMGPRGFTDVQKAQINKRLKAKVIKST